MKQRFFRLRRASREKGIVALWLILIALAIGASSLLARIDHLVFDLGQRLHRSAEPSGVVIVAIDESSLAKMGRWPWKREIHARLIDTLCAAKAAVVGLDIAFAEPASAPSSDKALASAMARCGKLVLPVVIETSGAVGPLIESPPIPDLAVAAAGLGRVGIALDEDGIARSVYLREGIGSAAWPLFAEELLRIGRHAAAADQVEAADPIDAGDGFELRRLGLRRLEFAGPPGTIPSISYASVLDGEFRPEYFAGKTVLVGVTAIGLGDFLPTPVSAQAQPMPGVEVQANVWLSLRDDRLIKPLPAWTATILSAVLALIPLLWLPRLMPLPGLLASLAWLLALVVVSAFLPVLFQFWFAPTGALAAGLSAFPLWSWRRLETARRHLDRELRQLRAILPAYRQNRKTSEEMRKMGFEQRIAWIQAAQRQMRQLEAQRNEALAFISHDLRTPLASVVQRLENDPGFPSGQLLPALRRAQAMAQEFLQLARAEALDPRQMKELELGSVLHQAIDEVYSLARPRGLQLCRRLPDDPVWIEGDFAALERTAINLLQNALNYAPEKTAITIGLETLPGRIRFWVENEGAAITPEQVEKIFRRFSRGEKGAAHPASTGLGLYYVHAVAEKHGGRSGVECTGGKVRFWVELPRDARREGQAASGLVAR